MGHVTQQRLSWTAILALPLRFAAGMTLLGTLDGTAMAHVYTPRRPRKHTICSSRDRPLCTRDRPGTSLC